MKQFFNMGGYAFYVWASYGIVLGVLIWQGVALFRRKVAHVHTES